MLAIGCQGEQTVVSGFTDAEIAECQSEILGAAQGASSTHGLYFGGFQEAEGTLDPTGGLIIANLPLDDGPIYGQMLNTYLDCNGHIGTGGTYKGTRSGTSLGGSWTMRQLGGTFGGTWRSNAKDGNRLVEGSYAIDSGPTTSMACGNPDGTQFGVDGCYCSSPGAFSLVKEGETPSPEAIPFAVNHGAKLTFDSQDNPSTAQDESTEAQRYAIVDVERLCSNESPLVAVCLNVLNLNPMELKYGANCEVDFPLDDGELIRAGLCPCVFLEPLVEDRWYIAIGINSSAGALGLSLDNLDVISSQTFQY